MAQEHEAQELTPLGTFVLAELGKSAVVVGDIRDITEHIGKTVTVHADGETRRVKLASQWQSARHGGTFFPLYRETGELKRNGELKRTRTGYKIGAAHIGDVNAEPMTFEDAMLFLNSANEAPAAPAKSMTRNVVKNAEQTSHRDADIPVQVPAALAAAIAQVVGNLTAAGMPPEVIAATVAAMQPGADNTAPAKSTAKKTPAKSTAKKTPAKSTRGTKKSTAKSTASADVDSLLAEL